MCELFSSTVPADQAGKPRAGRPPGVLLSRHVREGRAGCEDVGAETMRVHSPGGHGVRDRVPRAAHAARGDTLPRLRGQSAKLMPASGTTRRSAEPAFSKAALTAS